MTKRIDIKCTAYLMIQMATGTGDIGPYNIPRIISVAIYSSRTLSATGNSVYAEVMSVQGISYQDAREKLVKVINTYPQYAIFRPWVDSSYEAHQASLVRTQVIVGMNFDDV